MSFVNPLLLLGALAMAGPLILHLMLRDRAQRRLLPTLRFLPQSSTQSMARHKLKNLLLMMLRLAVLALAVLAFARPYIQRPTAAEPPKTIEEAAVFALDTSLSMRAGNRWDEAVGRATALAGNMPDGSHLALLLFDRTTRLVCGETADRAQFESALRESGPTMAGTDIVAGARAAADAASKMSARHRRVYLLTDFQDSGFNQLASELDLPAGVELVPLRIGDKAVPNAAITAMVEAPSAQPGRRTVRVQASGFGVGALKGDLELWNGNTRLATRTVTLENEQPVLADFELELKAFDTMLVTARLGVADALKEDNTAHLELRAAGSLPVLAAVRGGGAPAANAPAQANPYIRAAMLACGDAISPRWIDLAGLSGALATRYPVALADEGEAALGAPAAESMLAYIRAGGVLIFFPSPSGSAGLERLAGFKPEGQELPGGAEATGRLVSSVAAGSAVALPGEAGASLLGFPRAYRYYKMREDAPGQVRALLQLDDGRPFLLERKLGQGAVYLFTTALDPRCCDLVLRASFSPFLYQLLQYGAHYAETPTEYTVGELCTLKGAGAAAQLADPDGRPVREGQPFTVAGVYTLKRDMLSQAVVVRLEAKESDLRPMDPERITRLARRGQAGGETIAGPGAPASETDPVPDAPARPWRFLIMGALALMAAETLLASRTLR